jgi:hypothetical protein
MRPLKWMLLLGLGFCFQSIAVAGESRIWTSRKGSTLEAELLKADATSATLVTREAKQINLKIEDLSVGDRQFLV